MLALVFGLVEEKHKKRVADTLVKMITDNGYHLETGFVGTPYLCFALSDSGHTGTAYRLLLQTDCPSWLYPITKGATTIWEHWDGIKEDGSFWSSRMNSFNHYAYGSIGNWLYRVVAGINEAAPGYREILLSPVPGDGLDFAEAEHYSPYGKIASAWHRTSNGLRVEVTIPSNTTAVVRLPNAVSCELPAEAEERVVSDGWMSMELGSGSYIFEYDI